MAKRALVAPIFPGKARINNRHRLLGIAVIDREIAAFENLQSECQKIIVRYGFEISARPVSIRQIILTVHFVLAAAGERHAKAVRHCRGFELRIGPQCAHRPHEEIAARVLGRIGAFHQSHPRRVNAILVVTAIELRLIADRFDLQRCGNQQSSRQRDLPSHEHARDEINETTGVATSALFQDFSGAPARTQKRWNQTRNDGRDQCDDQREGKNASIDCELPPVRRRKRRSFYRPGQQVDTPIGNEHSGDRAKHGHNKTFGQHLPNEPPTGCTEGAANRQLFRAQRGATELHVHHVHARDQQDENDRGKHRPNDLAKLHASERIQQRLHACRGEVLVRLWIVLRQMPRDRDHLRVRLIERDPRLQSSQHRGRPIVGAQEKTAPRRWRELII